VRQPVCTKSSGDKRLCTSVADCMTSGVHKGAQGIGLLCTAAKCTMSGVHKGAQGLAVVHTNSRLYDEWCAQRCSGNWLLCTPARRTMCTKALRGWLLCTPPAICTTSSVHNANSSNGLLCTPPAKRVVSSVHKRALQGMGGCAQRQPIVR
jgi:hypothetical protein